MADRLLLAEKEWLEKHKHRFQVNSKKEGGNGVAVSGRERHRIGLMVVAQAAPTWSSSHRREHQGQADVATMASMAHWGQDCKRPKKENKEAKQPEANVAVGGLDQPTLLLAQVNVVVQAPMQVIHLAEDNVVPVVCPDGMWVFDTGAINHMTGTRSALAHLDEDFRCLSRCGV